MAHFRLGAALLIALLTWQTMAAQTPYQANLDVTNAAEAAWVDSVFNALTPEQRLGQLFMLRAHSNLGPDHVAAVERLIREQYVGGLCFFQGTPAEQARLTNRYQAMSKVPLMIAIDGEWGLGMRMKETTISYPRQLMLGAIQQNRLLYDMGREVARQLRRLGIHVNFAPVVDVNNNPANPVIGNRSFGEDRYNVTAKSYMYAKGMQDNGILACAKHFPGHGDTDVDSHLDLPVITHDRRRLDSIELYPFRALAQYGIGSFMVAHLEVPALESRPNRPTTLSAATATQLLRGELNFHGLAFTDALDMQGVTKFFNPGQVEAEALLAGNDILVLPKDVAAARREIAAYLADGRLNQADLDRRVKRVLRAKYRLNVHRFKPIREEGLSADLNSPEAIALKHRLTEASMTLVRNRDGLLPFAEVDNQRMAALAIGAGSQPKFHQRLADYAQVSLFRTGSNPSEADQEQLMRSLAGKDVVIVSLHGMNSKSNEHFGVSQSARNLIEQLRRKHRVVLTVFGSPYSLRYFDAVDWVLEAYDEDPITQDVAAQALFGAIGVSGKLPVTASPTSRFNAGQTTRRNFRMGYTVPERVGMDGNALGARIDTIAKEAIASGATPGCVVLVARQGQVVFEKAYGYHTYAQERPVQTNDIYDLASITKVAATTLAVMRLKDEGLIDLDRPLGEYLPELAGTNKAALLIRDVLAHRAGLHPWIPFYQATLDQRETSAKPRDEYYSRFVHGPFSVPVADNLYLREDRVDSLWQQLYDSPLRGSTSYRYSDLGFYLLARLVERVSGEPIDAYAHRHFYAPLGLHQMGYRPLERFPAERIPPTEEDQYWRQQRIQGHVHDMGAAMLGGVSGHAGLFGTAHDLAVLAQMLLQRGSYGDRQYLDPATVREFTRRYAGETRRGLGFDMKQLNTAYALNVARETGDQAFGHTGFTGTCVWADPEQELVFVFLSNRTYPSMNNNRLQRLDIRERMQAAAYDAIRAHTPEPASRIAELIPELPAIEMGVSR